MDTQKQDLNFFNEGNGSLAPSDPAYLAGKPGGPNGKSGTGLILPGGGQSGDSNSAFVTLGKGLNFLGPQFPLL